MKRERRMPGIAIVTGLLTVAGGWAAFGQDKYTLKVPNGLAFSEFRGYETWQVVSITWDTNLNLMAAILANPVMIQAYLAGAPNDGKPFPDGAKLAKITGTPIRWRRSPQRRFQVLNMTSTSW